jgi:hypothetical protein
MDDIKRTPPPGPGGRPYSTRSFTPRTRDIAYRDPRLPRVAAPSAQITSNHQLPSSPQSFSADVKRITPRPTYTPAHLTQPIHKSVNQDINYDQLLAGPVTNPIISSAPNQNLPANSPSAFEAQPKHRNKAARLIPTRKVKLNKHITLGAVILIVASAFALFVLPYSKTTATKLTPAQQKAHATLLVLEKTPQYQDASKIGAGLGLYESSNANQLPQTLGPSPTPRTITFCGSNCQGQSESINVGPLEYYMAAAVFLKSYSNSLTITNSSSLYIVAHATCNNSGSRMVDAPSNSSAILFDVSQSDQIEQKCLSA